MERAVVFTLLATLAASVLLGGTAEAQTVTRGTLELEKLAAGITEEVSDYTHKREILVDEIVKNQKRIEDLRKEYQKAGGEKERVRLRAESLREISQLLDFYERYYGLTIQTVENILPGLEKMRQSARQGVLGTAARQLEDPRFKRDLNSLYGNLSGFAMRFDNPRLKREVAVILKENELLYRQGAQGANAFEGVSANIDRVSDFLRSAYARTVQKCSILQRKKAQAGLAVDLMRYALALKPIQQNLARFDPKILEDIPELDYQDLLDPLLEEAAGDGTTSGTAGTDPDVDTALRGFLQGVNFEQ